MIDYPSVELREFLQDLWDAQRNGLHTTRLSKDQFRALTEREEELVTGYAEAAAETTVRSDS